MRIDDQSRTYHHLFPSIGLMARAGQVQLMMNYGTRSMHNAPDNDSRQSEATVRYKFNATSSKWRGSGAGAAEKARFGGGN